MTYAARKDQAHYLIDAITPEQLDAVVGLLEVIASPQDRRLAAIPIEDELISDEENAAVAAAASSTAPAVPFDDILAEYGTTLEELLQQKPSSPLPENIVRRIPEPAVIR